VTGIRLYRECRVTREGSEQVYVERRKNGGKEGTMKEHSAEGLLEGRV
jgi:hypothetical protein